MKFDDLFQNITVPILVYLDGEAPAVVYGNRAAASLLNPLSAMEDCRFVHRNSPVNELLQVPAEDFQIFSTRLEQSGEVSEFETRLRLQSGELVPVTLSANKLEADGRSHVKICIYPLHIPQTTPSHAQALVAALNVAYRAKTVDSAIEKVLSFIGHYLEVSRVYIMEEASDTTVSNTYEWCAAQVEPRQQHLQNMNRKQQPYDGIIGNGLAVIDDAPLFPKGSTWGAKSTLSAPVFSSKGAMGYVGFDDCLHHRKWSQEEVVLLQDFSEMLASLLIRRDGERSLRYSLEILNTVTDNFENLVYVSDIHNDKILFANNALAAAAATPPDRLLGKNCAQILQKFGRNPSEKYPFNIMIGTDGQILKKHHTWEFRNASNGKWYLVRNAIIKWIDGRDVHIETATEITNQKENEAQLEYIASMDMMTGIYNREWGRRLIQHLLDFRQSGQKATLVFLDLDDLKSVNDQHGHAIGDKMIIKTVELIQSCIRKSDSLCRWGGDEFVMVIRATQEDAARVMGKILNRIDQYNAKRESLFQLSFSYGLVEISPSSSHSVESIIAQADQKMYVNKMERIRLQPQ